jgi:hypothetical protein
LRWLHNYAGGRGDVNQSRFAFDPPEGQPGSAIQATAERRITLGEFAMNSEVISMPYRVAVSL